MRSTLYIQDVLTANVQVLKLQHGLCELTSKCYDACKITCTDITFHNKLKKERQDQDKVSFCSCQNRIYFGAAGVGHVSTFVRLCTGLMQTTRPCKERQENIWHVPGCKSDRQHERGQGLVLSMLSMLSSPQQQYPQGSLPSCLV